MTAKCWIFPLRASPTNTITLIPQSLYSTWMHHSKYIKTQPSEMSHQISCVEFLFYRQCNIYKERVMRKWHHQKKKGLTIMQLNGSANERIKTTPSVSAESLTDGGDVRRVEFVVRESAQQTCFPNPRISEKQESEEHIVLLGHGVGCGVELKKKHRAANSSAMDEQPLPTCIPCLLRRSTSGWGSAPSFFVCLFVHWRWVGDG